MRKLAQNKVSESRWTLPLAALYTVGVWLLYGLVRDELWLQFALLAATSFLMMQLNKLHVLIRIYSRMVSSTFLVLSCCACFLFPVVNEALASAFIVLTYILLFTSYQDKEATGKVFYAFLSLGIASIANVHTLFFVPVFWVFLAKNLSVLSWRTWFASILGLLTPYWFTAAWLLSVNSLESLLDHLAQLLEFHKPFDLTSIPIEALATYCLINILMFIGIVHFIRKSYAENIRTRMFYTIFIWMGILSASVLAIQPQYYDLLIRIMIINTAPLIAHFFSLTSTKVTNATFYILVAVTFALTAYNVWNTSSLF